MEFFGKKKHKETEIGQCLDFTFVYLYIYIFNI